MSYYTLGVQRFQNKYGTLVVEPITGDMNVRDIHGKDVPDEFKFTLEVAEQIALITDNWHVQMALTMGSSEAKCQGYLCLHTSCSTAFVVKITTLEYIGPNAKEEIERVAQREPRWVA